MARLLVLGGTRFVGRAIVERALQQGHDVTLFNRGSTDPDAFAGSPRTHRIAGDRHGNDVARLGTDTWEAVIDISAYQPYDVRRAIAALHGQSPHYLFISTVSVYAPGLPPGSDESGSLIEVEENVRPDSPLAYGGRKVHCERLLRAAIEDRLTVLRPTVVIGPRDPTNRFGLWVRRIAEGGVVQVPRRVQQPVQLIDARDLAAFAVRCVEQRILGTYNVAGPAKALTLGGMIDTVAAMLRVKLDVVPVLEGQEFPLTLAEDGSEDGHFSVSIAAALAQGLELRPLRESASDVWEWEDAGRD